MDSPEGWFTEVRLDACTHQMTPGAPKLPVFRKILRAPLEAELSAWLSGGSVQDLSFAELGVEHPVMPTQPSLSKGVNPEDQPFFHDPVLCAVGDLDTTPEILVHELGILRGVRLVQLEVHPVQIDPVAGILRVHNELELQVQFSGADWDATAELEARTRSPYFESLYHGSFINYQSTSRDTITGYPVKYVIVTDPMFTDQLADFIDWKTRKGFEVIVGEVGSPELGSTTTSI